MVGGGQPGRARPTTRTRLPVGGARGSSCQPRAIAWSPEEALHGVDPDGLVDLAPVAGRLARVVAHPAHDGRQRVVPMIWRQAAS